MKHRVLFNPYADNGKGKENAEQIRSHFPASDTFVFEDLTKLEDVYATLCTAEKEEQLILTGGDGTINRFANAIGGRPIPRSVYYFASGTGNDFYADIKDKEHEPILLLNPYLENLPTVTVKGKTSYFLNGIGYGIDGYGCEEGDRQRAKSDKPVNYTSIAIKGLLFHYKPVNATVTVDGVVHTYRKVWVCPTMNGRFYGGGMMVAPTQDRLAEDGMLSVVIAHGCNKLKMLTVFPGIFKGAHVKHTEMVEILKGHDIKVEFDLPIALQIDGETVTGVTSCHSLSRVKVAQVKAEMQV